MEIEDMDQLEMLEFASSAKKAAGSAKKAAGRKRKGVMKSPSAAIALEGSELFSTPSTSTPKNKKMRLNSSSRKKSAENNSSESTEKAAGEHTGARKLFMYL
jgi:hypothetical protein